MIPIYYDLFSMIIAGNLMLSMIGGIILLSPIFYDSRYRKSLTTFGRVVSVYGILTFFSGLIFIPIWAFKLWL